MAIKKKVAPARRRIAPQRRKILVIPIDAKYRVVKKENPFRENSGRGKRAAAVLRSKSVKEAIKRGARKSSIRWLVRHRRVRLAA